MATYKDVLMLVDKVSEPLKKIQNNTDKLQDKFKKLQAGMKKVAGVMATVGTAVVVVGGAILRASKQVADYGDRIDKMSQKIGMSRKSFQEWDYIMSQNGGSVESLQMGFKTLTTQIAGVQKGSKESVQAFKMLGVSIKDNNGELRSQDEIFNDTIRKLQQIKNPTQKAMLANKLFGRSAAELRPLLNQEASAVDNLREKANKLGLIITDDDIDNAVKFKDTMDTFTRFFQAKFGTTMMKIMPSLTQATEQIIELSQQNEQTFSDLGNALNWVTTKALPAVVKAIFWVADAIRYVAGRYGEIIGQILALPTEIQARFIEAQNTILRVWLAIRKGVAASIDFIIQKLIKLLQALANIASKIPLLKGLGATLGGIASNMQKNTVNQTQNNNTTNNSTVNNNYYGGGQKNVIGGMLQPAYVMP